MKNLVNKQLLIPLGVIALSYAFLDPLMVLMPTMAVYVAIALFFSGYIGFALLMWREKVTDEREVAHRAYAARIAYLAGTGVLVIGIIYQVLKLHEVEPLLILTLTVMIYSKIYRTTTGPVDKLVAWVKYRARICVVLKSNYLLK